MKSTRGYGFTSVIIAWSPCRAASHTTATALTWFPVSTPRAYSSAAADPTTFRLLEQQKLELLDWLRIHGPEKPLMLVRTPLYDRMAPDLADLTTPLIQETGLKRNGLTLVQVRDLERPTLAPR